MKKWRFKKQSAFEGSIRQGWQTLVIKQYQKRIVLSNYPDMSRVMASVAQKAARSRFARAAKFASAIVRDSMRVRRYRNS